MLIGCGLALLLIFTLPSLGLGRGWVLAVAFGVMMLCHLVHFGMHKSQKAEEKDNN
jgi:hypothetical protein